MGRLGRMCGRMNCNVNAAMRYCIRNCTDVSSRGAGNPPLRWPKRALLNSARHVLRPNHANVSSEHFTSLRRGASASS